MKIKYFSELDVRFHTTPSKGRRWELLQDFTFTVDDEPFTVPKMFYTDFASIPRIIWPIISPYDLGKGPIPHDFGFFSGLKDFKFWNEVLLDCMRTEEISFWKRPFVYGTVSSFFGKRVWNNYRKQGNSERQLLHLKVRSLV